MRADLIIKTPSQTFSIVLTREDTILGLKPNYMIRSQGKRFVACLQYVYVENVKDPH